MFSTVLAASMNAANSVLAQVPAGPTTGPAGGADGGAAPSLFSNPLILLVVVLGIFWFVMSRDQRKKKGQRQQMLANLKKGDKVLTIGGAVGTIVGIKDTEVVVKVDESSNVKITFLRSAIDRVVSSREGTQENA
jgi:preprotein translocase subunit YajC